MNSSKIQLNAVLPNGEMLSLTNWYTWSGKTISLFVPEGGLEFAGFSWVIKETSSQEGAFIYKSNPEPFPWATLEGPIPGKGEKIRLLGQNKKEIIIQQKFQYDNRRKGLWFHIYKMRK